MYMSTAITEILLLEACHIGDYNTYIICINELNYLYMTWSDIENIFSDSLLGGNKNILHDICNIILIYTQKKGISWQFGYTLEILAKCRTINQMEMFVDVFKDTKYYLNQIFIGAIRGTNIELLTWLLENYKAPEDILMYVYMTGNDTIIQLVHNTNHNYDLKYAMTGACMAKDLKRMNMLYNDYQVRGILLNHAFDKMLELYEPYENIILWLLTNGANINEKNIKNWYNKMEIMRPFACNNNVFNRIKTITNNKLNRVNKKNKLNKAINHNNSIDNMYDQVLDNLSDLNVSKKKIAPSSNEIVKKLTGLKL
jgi:hypothetical protein